MFEVLPEIMQNFDSEGAILIWTNATRKVIELVIRWNLED